MPETDTILNRAMSDAAEAPAASAKADYEALAEPNKKRTDRYIWGIYLLLLLVSLVELFSASSQEVTADNIYGPIIRHAQFLGIGLLIMLGLQRLHYRWIYFCTPAFVVASIGAMVLVLLVGVNINGARRGLGIGSFVVLPAEFIKLAAALGMAWILARNQLKKCNDVSTRGVAYCLALVGVCCALLFSHGLTNTLLIVAISLSMMVVGGVSMKKIGIVFLCFTLAGGGAVLYKLAGRNDKVTEQAVRIAELNKEEVKASSGNRSDTWIGRLERHFRLAKYEDPINNLNKQEQFSYMAQAHGGLFGVGPGNSRENARLPLAFSDYIYAIVIEECGMVTGVVVLLLYLLLLARQHCRALQTDLPLSAGNWLRAVHSLSGPVPHGHCVGRISGFRPAPASDQQGRHLNYSHLDSLGHNAVGKPARCRKGRQRGHTGRNESSARKPSQ